MPNHSLLIRNTPNSESHKPFHIHTLSYYLDKRPFWFNAEHLMNPYRVYLEAWLVEAIFGPGGEHIPHVECVSQTILRVRRVDPEGKAEILIFGRPYYQKDIAKIITNLADYHRQRREQ
uniref:KH-like RNA-binding domain-containing protein n=1 Tax=Loxodonta africana TaxID=9785 RepID=G3TA04_LOXAF